MKVLLSAYSCEPNKGSEPGVGWHWAIELANLGHEVWVITRANNQVVIEKALSAKPCPNLHFVYYDLPAWMQKLKKGPGGVYVYYLFWQLGIYQTAKSLTQSTAFDWVHHITFGVLRQPSFLAFLPVPFILGPLGGGESAPYSLRKGFQLRGYIQDSLRDLSNYLVAFDPVANAVFNQSTIIFCKTKETLSCIPRRYHEKCHISLEIGIDSPTDISIQTQSKKQHDERVFRVLYVGRLIYWKGLHLGLPAFSHFHKQFPHSRLTVIGSGADSKWLHQLAQQLEIDHAIDWIPWLEQEKVMQQYLEHDVFLFPSLHDSSGNVILESLSHGLPLICLDLGGPGVLANESCAKVVRTSGLSEQAVIQALADNLRELASNSELLNQLGTGAYQRANEYQWTKLVHRLYASIDEKAGLGTSS